MKKREEKHTLALEPEDGGERSREEDTFDSSERNKSLGEGGVFVRDPCQGPVCLLSNARDGVNGIEQVSLLLVVLDVCIDQQAVHLGMDVLNHDLETVI